jgi:head-tail adaptor
MPNLLKDVFYLEVNTIEADSTGGHTDNWDFSRTFKGRLSRLPIKEQIGNDKVTVYATHKLYCEYITVTTADRVRLGTRYFDIITVENPRNWNKHLELLLLEVE